MIIIFVKTVQCSKLVSLASKQKERNFGSVEVIILESLSVQLRFDHTQVPFTDNFKYVISLNKKNAMIANMTLIVGIISVFKITDSTLKSYKQSRVSSSKFTIKTSIQACKHQFYL